MPGQAPRAPEGRGFQNVKIIRHKMVVRLSALRTSRLHPPPPLKKTWYSFLLEPKSTPEPWCGRKDYVHE
jgi:hypothetical protein